MDAARCDGGCRMQWRAMKLLQRVSCRQLPPAADIVFSHADPPHAQVVLEPARTPHAPPRVPHRALRAQVIRGTSLPLDVRTERLSRRTPGAAVAPEPLELEPTSAGEPSRSASNSHARRDSTSSSDETDGPPRAVAPRASRRGGACPYRRLEAARGRRMPWTSGSERSVPRTACCLEGARCVREPRPCRSTSRSASARTELAQRVPGRRASADAGGGKPRERSAPELRCWTERPAAAAVGAANGGAHGDPVVGSPLRGIESPGRTPPWDGPARKAGEKRHIRPGLCTGGCSRERRGPSPGPDPVRWVLRVDAQATSAGGAGATDARGRRRSWGEYAMSLHGATKRRAGRSDRGELGPRSRHTPRSQPAIIHHPGSGTHDRRAFAARPTAVRDARSGRGRAEDDASTLER